MKLKGKNILLISPEMWGGLHVSKHHYAIHLAAMGNRVFFLGPPSYKSPTKLIGSSVSNLYLIKYSGFIRGIRLLPSLLQKILIRRKFQELQSTALVKFDIVWSFDNSVFFDFEAINQHALCISHIVDLNQDFNTIKAARTADLCLASSGCIKKKLLEYNPNTHFINHGYNYKRHKSAFNFGCSNQKLNVGYAGNFDIKYLNWALIEVLLKEFPNVIFNFAGMGRNNHYYKIRNFKNFKYIGLLPSEQLTYFYEQMDILVICYKYEEYPDQLANPHKMMEYLASGKMIVATWTEEYADLNEQEMIKMVKTNDQFKKTFKEVVSNIDFWNSKELLEKRRMIARLNTYEQQIQRVEDAISNSL
ncbi:MAG: hypothetical protein AAF693_08380 [Bacteroidota bacterium]